MNHKGQTSCAQGDQGLRSHHDDLWGKVDTIDIKEPRFKDVRSPEHKKCYVSGDKKEENTGRRDEQDFLGVGE